MPRPNCWVAARRADPLLFGDLVAARALLERCLGLADPGIAPSVGTVLRSLRGDAPLAVTLAYLGYVDQARSRMDEALSEARRLGHVHTLAMYSVLRFGWIGSPLA